MSFLHQLKTQANQLQNAQAGEDQHVAQRIAITEKACHALDTYCQELARQLSVIEPVPSKPFALDGRKPWPPMKLVQFSADARRKTLRGQTVYDYIAVGWDIIPQSGVAAPYSVEVNFPPELQKVETRLAQGFIRHTREDVRHPDTKKLLAYRFDCKTEARGTLIITPEHEAARLRFAFTNVNGFDKVETLYPAQQITPVLMDEMAKVLALQPSHFV